LRAALALATFSAVVVASASSAQGADADRPRLALSASPAQITLTPPGSRRIKLRNDGATLVVVDVTRRTIGVQTSKKWFQVAPPRVTLRAGGSAVLTVRVKQGQGAEPGEHQALVLLTTRGVSGGRVSVQVRVGIRIRMRVAGHIVRQVALGRPHVRLARRGLFIVVPVANRGNVTVELRGKVAASLHRRGRKPIRLQPRTRVALLPGARSLLALRLGRRLRGPVTAIVRIRLGPGAPLAERRYRLRL
jgi:hypothetical protein